MNIFQFFDVADQIADLAGDEFLDGFAFRHELAQFEHLVGGFGFEKANFLSLLDRALHQPHVGDRAAVVVVVGIEQHRLQRARWDRPVGGGMRCDDRFQQLGHAHAGFAAATEDLLGLDAQYLLHFQNHFIRPGVLQIDFIEHRNDRQVVFHRRQSIGHGLGFHALKRIDQQNGPFAAGQAPRDFVMEIDVAGRVDQVQFKYFEAAHPSSPRREGGEISHRNRAGFDRDAALAFQRHVVEQLLLHFPLLDRAG